MRIYTCLRCEGKGVYTEDDFKSDCRHCKCTGQVNYVQDICLTENLSFEIERMESFKTIKKWMVEVTLFRDKGYACSDGYSDDLVEQLSVNGKIPYHEYKCDSWGKSYKQAVSRSLKKCKEAGFL